MLVNFNLGKFNMINCFRNPMDDTVFFFVGGMVFSIQNSNKSCTRRAWKCLGTNCVTQQTLQPNEMLNGPTSVICVESKAKIIVGHSSSILKNQPRVARSQGLDVTWQRPCDCDPGRIRIKGRCFPKEFVVKISMQPVALWQMPKRRNSPERMTTLAKYCKYLHNMYGYLCQGHCKSSHYLRTFHPDQVHYWISSGICFMPDSGCDWKNNEWMTQQ